MSTPGFSFPPPPPPPPQRSYDANTQTPRGRGYGGGQFRGRGAPGGSTWHRGSLGGGRGRGGSYGAANHVVNRSAPVHELNPSFKRTHTGQPRPRAPPAVPSFNASIQDLVSSGPPAKHRERETLSRKQTNLLGLTPANAEGSDSEDDLDEESRLLGAGSPDDLRFEYRGQTSTLRTPAEIAAWIAERRKRWPTQERREAAKKEAAEKKRRREEEKAKRAEAVQAAKKKRAEIGRDAVSDNQTQKPQDQSRSDATAESEAIRKAQARTERLRRKVLKAQERLQAAENKLPKVSANIIVGDTAAEPTLEATVDDSDDDSGGLSESSILTDSTSSMESDSGSDSAPEESSSKIVVEDIVPASRKPARTKKPCQFFAKHGSCKYGARCKYSHEPQQVRLRRPQMAAVGVKQGRKGLWQVMVEKEQEEERKKVLHAIIALGQQGVLDAP